MKKELIITSVISMLFGVSLAANVMLTYVVKSVQLQTISNSSAIAQIVDFINKSQPVKK